ncbi:DUF4395 domain-containing protein [Streptomyces incanus]
MTTVVPAVVLVTEGVWLPARQTPAFACGTAGGVGRSPYGWLFRRVLRPRIGPATDFDAPEPSRFAQAVGLVFAVVGLLGFSLGPDRLGLAMTGAALAAASLNAVFGHCLGCEMHLPLWRMTVGAG